MASLTQGCLASWRRVNSRQRVGLPQAISLRRRGLFVMRWDQKFFLESQRSLRDDFEAWSDFRPSSGQRRTEDVLVRCRRKEGSMAPSSLSSGTNLQRRRAWLFRVYRKRAQRGRRSIDVSGVRSTRDPRRAVKGSEQARRILRATNDRSRVVDTVGVARATAQRPKVAHGSSFHRKACSSPCAS